MPAGERRGHVIVVAGQHHAAENGDADRTTDL